MGIKANRTRSLRYKRPALASMGYDSIITELDEIYSACQDIQYYVDDDDGTLLNALDGDDEAEWKFKMAFSDLSAKAERLYEHVYEEVRYQGHDGFERVYCAGEPWGQPGSHGCDQVGHGRLYRKGRAPVTALKPIFLVPVLHEKLWGGNRLQEQFGYQIPSDHTGECWAISAHPNGDCRIRNPEYANMTLSGLWRKHPELFGHAGGGSTFPLLVKIIDAREDLSIQVHPDDTYAQLHENGSLGKTECWYVLDCCEGATIIVGHNAESPEQLKNMVANGLWDKLLREIPIQKGDFFQIDPGCPHAIKSGTLLLETQQSSDVTYRFYDYDRFENGKPRTLHIDQSLAVTRVPFTPNAQERAVFQEGGAHVTQLVACPYYTVYHVEMDGIWEKTWEQPFVNVSVINGRGMLDGQEVVRGDHFLIPNGYGLMTLEGKLELICSHQ